MKSGNGFMVKLFHGYKKNKIKNNETMKQLNNESAFTLIEIIIAMAIVSIIAGSLWGNFFTSIAKGRDSRRKQDLDSISKALELYYTDNKNYPTAMPTWGTQFVHPSDSNVVYMQKLPADPGYPNSNYCYNSIDGSFFKLYANLENKSDPKILSPTVACSGTGYNYGIASPNSNP